MTDKLEGINMKKKSQSFKNWKKKVLKLFEKNFGKKQIHYNKLKGSLRKKWAQHTPEHSCFFPRN